MSKGFKSREQRENFFINERKKRNCGRKKKKLGKKENLSNQYICKRVKKIKPKSLK